VGYVLEPDRPVQDEVHRIAAERLDEAIAHLDLIGADADHADVETAVHEARKRCKASRGLARLVKPALGDGFRTFDRLVRDAARELSSLRDAHAVLNTLDVLLDEHPDAGALHAVRHRQAAISSDAARTAVGPHDPRISTARTLLVDARAASQAWWIPRGFDAVEAGLAATYRQGRSALRRTHADPTDARVHDWRKAVKYLWYQVQLVHEAAPSVLGPLEGQLDGLADTLGNDHDLAVLVALLDEHPDRYGTSSDVAAVSELARKRQRELRERALRSGATIYAEPDHAFAQRMARYWQLAIDLGPEVPDHAEQTDAQGPPARSVVERERKFLVDAVPADLDRSTAVALRQGYLAADERSPGRSTVFSQAAVRVRDAGPEGCTLTVKAGSGAVRTELEWPIEQGEFDAAWPHTEGRRIEKKRHRIPFGDHVIELDVFGGDLDGLVIAEVEFDSGDAMDAFEPPPWFGREVTDDRAYANATLALEGPPEA
jgi:CYTH domain-containing protein/CHAD domain-containing protein